MRVCDYGRGWMLGCNACAIKRGHQLHEFLPGLLVDLRELNTHSRKEKKAFGLVPGPGDFGLRFVLFPGTIRKGKLDGEFSSRRQGRAAFDEQSAATDSTGQTVELLSLRSRISDFDG